MDMHRTGRRRIRGERRDALIVSVLLFVFGAVSVFPLFWMLSTSLKDGGSIYTYPPEFVPKHPSLAPYVRLFNNSRFPTWFMNSCIVSGTAIVLTLLSTSMAGYAFSKTEFPGRKAIFLLIISTLMIPYFILCLPLFNLVARLGLVNTYWALILPQVASPVAIFILKQYTDTIPNELLAAAKIDGAGEARIYWRIVFPLTTPALAAVAILTFLSCWNSFFWPLVVTTSAKMRTLPVGLATLHGQFQSEWSLSCAAAFISLLPALILYVFLQKYFVQGVAMSGVKG